MGKKQTFYNNEWVDELACREFVEWVTDYLEVVLPADERKRIEAHLAQCSSCPHYLEQIRETIQAVGKLSDTLDEVTPRARAELLGMFKRLKSEKTD
jgi:anti-sigma factor RsiW